MGWVGGGLGGMSGGVVGQGIGNVDPEFIFFFFLSNFGVRISDRGSRCRHYEGTSR